MFKIKIKKVEVEMEEPVSRTRLLKTEIILLQISAFQKGHLLPYNQIDGMEHFLASS